VNVAVYSMLGRMLGPSYFKRLPCSQLYTLRKRVKKLSLGLYLFKR